MLSLDATHLCKPSPTSTNFSQPPPCVLSLSHSVTGGSTTKLHYLLISRSDSSRVTSSSPPDHITMSAPLLIVIYALLGLWLVGAVLSQSTSSNFSTLYSLNYLGSVTGLPQLYGTLAFDPTNPNSMLMTGAIDTSSGGIYRVPVQRDATGHISGFGNATFLASVPGIDSCSSFFPNSTTLLVSSWSGSSTSLSQFLPNTSSASSTIPLSALNSSAPTGASCSFALDGSLVTFPYALKWTHQRVRPAISTTIWWPIQPKWAPSFVPVTLPCPRCTICSWRLANYYQSVSLDD